MYGTVALLEAADQALIAGFVVNKFRGDRTLLEPGLDQLTRLTGRPTEVIVAGTDDAPAVMFVAGGFVEDELTRARRSRRRRGEDDDHPEEPVYASFNDYSPTESLFFHTGGGEQEDPAGDQAVDAAPPTPYSLLGVSPIQWTQPLMAGGIYTTADCYAAFLRKILNGTLNIAALLGTHQVPASALLGASNSPAPVDEPWHYSIGHWVEPDGTYSSGGSLGFYPWIDVNRRTYGIVARNSLTGSDTGTIGIESVRTGQSIRAAWFRQ